MPSFIPQLTINGVAMEGAPVRRAVSEAPDPSVALAHSGQIGKAEDSFRERLRRDPKDSFAHHNFAVFLSEQKRISEAAEYYRQALRIRPDYPEALSNFAVLLSSQRQFQEAARHLWAAIALRPNDVQTLVALGSALLEAHRGKESIPVLRHAVRLSPSEAMLHNQLGLALFDSGYFEEAESVFLECLRLEPRLVSGHNNLGSLYKAMGRSAEAFACFEIALALEPDSLKSRWNRALAYLSVGDFERGWEEYECRWKRPETPPKQFPVPPWKGEPLVGRRILLHAEQGLGDTIQFIRYAAILKKQGAKVFFECPMPLAGVLKGAAGIDRLLMEGQPIPPFDFHAPLLGLPRLCKTSLATVPATIPYLQAEAERIAAWEPRLDALATPGELRVGIAWRGNPHHQWDHFRSVPLMAFEPLTEIAGVRLVSLQRGPGIEQMDVFQKLTGDRLLVPTDGQQTTPEHLADTAAIMKHLDLVICVDTATAHLAGALGCRVWVMLSAVADWRWMVERMDSPWYPAMRLFRQKKFGDWEEVVTRMARHLVEMRNISSGK